MDNVVARQVYGVLESKFGPMKVVIGKEHGFLGSIITCSDDRRFEKHMSRYISDIVDEFGETPAEVVTPARSGIFEGDFSNLWLTKKKEKKSSLNMQNNVSHMQRQKGFATYSVIPSHNSSIVK